MRDMPAGICDVEIVVHNDDETPWQFVIDLVRSVFGRSETEANALTQTVAEQGKAVCGTYAPAVADAILRAAKQRIAESGHRLLITTAPRGAEGNDGQPAANRLS